MADVTPILILVVAAFFVLGGRDSDPGAAIRRQLDERQTQQRLRVQALVGRVLSLAVAIAYVVASATSTPLWPWAILLGLLGISFLAGWFAYGERGGPRSQDTAG